MRDAVGCSVSNMGQSVRALVVIDGVRVRQKNGRKSGTREFRECCRARPRHDEGRRLVSSRQILEERFHESVRRQCRMSGTHRVELTRSRLMHDAPAGSCLTDQMQLGDNRVVERVGSLATAENEQLARSVCRGGNRICGRGRGLDNLAPDWSAGEFHFHAARQAG